MYNNGMFWVTLICLILMAAVFIDQMKPQLYGGTSVFHKMWCSIRGLYYRITGVAGFGITKLQSKSSREPEEELLRYPLGGSNSLENRWAVSSNAEAIREDTRGERRRKAYRLKILR